MEHFEALIDVNEDEAAEENANEWAAVLRVAAPTSTCDMIDGQVAPSWQRTQARAAAARIFLPHL